MRPKKLPVATRALLIRKFREREDLVRKIKQARYELVPRRKRLMDEIREIAEAHGVSLRTAHRAYAGRP